MGDLIIVEIGAFPGALLDRLARQIGPALGLTVSSERPLMDPAFAYHEGRGQFLAGRLLAELRRFGDAGSRVVGAASVDLCIPILTFVFGEADMPGRAAAFSIHRLRQEFYGLPADPDLLAERARKEMMHELGHTFGLPHCHDAACVMSSSHAVDAVDSKGSEMCPQCRAVMERQKSGSLSTVLSQP